MPDNKEFPVLNTNFGTSPMHPLVILPNGSEGTNLGSGTIVSLLGEGGGALVYEIWNERLGVKRAAKLLKPSSTSSSRDRFESEIKITASLKHPNIIEIHSVGEWQGLPYIEMEKLEGSTLEKFIKTRGALPLEMACAIGIIILRALTFTHNHEYLVNGKKHRGILHRDLKPANIMLCDNGAVKLMDFGIARPVDAPRQTIEGSFSGSLPYVAPEQLLGEPIDERADVFSFGCVLYEMITGKETFGEKTLTRLVADRSKNNYIPITYFGIKMPPNLARLITNCLLQEKNRRIQSSTAALVQLEKIFERITSNTPEEVVKLFQSTFQQKQKIKLKKSPYVFQRVFAVTAIMIALGVLCFYFFELRQHHVFESRHTSRIIVPEQAPLSAPRATGPAPISAQAGVPIPPSLTSVSTKAPPKHLTHPVSGQKTTPAPRPAGIALLERLSVQYGTKDVGKIFEHEIENGNFTGGLALWDNLIPAQKNSSRLLLYKMRGLKGARNESGLGRFFNTTQVNDAEYYFTQAQFSFGHGRVEAALEQLKKVTSAPAELADKGDLERSAACLTARCRYKLFSTVSSEENRQAALESWGNVKYLFQKNQTDECYREASSYIRLLSNTQP
ncbi:MAG: serine/threonine-protein kinase [Chitinivibrionales bacterium]|nr:serine/threonine-protein kinase [Chitinivibrionales bacterium]